MTVGTRIRAARQGLGLSQRELAERLGTSRANVSRWETGRATPGLDWLDALCRALEVPADWFRVERA